MCDLAINVLRMSIIFKVLVVSVYCNWSGGSNQEMAPVVETTHENKEFAIVDVIIVFSFGKCLGMETNGCMFTLVVFLCEYGTGGVHKGIHLKEEGFSGVRLMECKCYVYALDRL